MKYEVHERSLPPLVISRLRRPRERVLPLVVAALQPSAALAAVVQLHLLLGGDAALRTLARRVARRGRGAGRRVALLPQVLPLQLVS